MLRTIAAFAAIVLCTSAQGDVLSNAVMNYSTDFPSPATPHPSLPDAHGSFMGFTHRLPGTGTAIVGNDPHAEVLTDRLAIQGQGGSLITGAGLESLDMLSVVARNVHHANYVTHYGYGGASFANLQLGPSGKAGIFLGVDAANLFLAGVESVSPFGHYRLFAAKIVEGAITSIPVSDPGQTTYLPGTSVDFLFGRATVISPDTFWVSASTADSPSGPLMYDATAWSAIPSISAAHHLHAGVFYFDASTQVLSVETFFFGSVPEPSSYALAIVGAVAAMLFRFRRLARL